MSTRPEVQGSPARALQIRREVGVQRERGASIERTTDFVAEERPIALLYQERPYVVMLASPADLEDLGVGFTVTEGLVAATSEIRAAEVVDTEESFAVNMQITGERFAELLRRQRNLTARSGCGLCGVETVGDAIRSPVRVRTGLRVARKELREQLSLLPSRQTLNLSTGSVHAAAWALPGRGIQLVREDVGRHNALDKVVGALVRANVDCSDGYMIITSRASFEMVQKAAMVGISLLVAVSAPTAMAIDIAEQTGMTLVGFARADRWVIYTHAERLQD